jgi:hypothetical protein
VILVNPAAAPTLDDLVARWLEGGVTLRDLAVKHGVSPATICRHAKRTGRNPGLRVVSCGGCGRSIVRQKLRPGTIPCCDRTCLDRATRKRDAPRHACSRCRMTGHNRRTCHQVDVIARPRTTRHVQNE